MNPTAHVINLAHRTDRWERLQESWSRYFQLVRVPVAAAPKSRRFEDIRRTHIRIAESQLASERTVIVMEDDVIPTPLFDLSYIHAAIATPDEWDHVNLAPLLDLTTFGRPRAELSPAKSELFFRTTYSHYTGLVIYNRASLAALKQIRANRPHDVYINPFLQNQWTPRRLIAREWAGYSDTFERVEDRSYLYDLTEALLKKHRHACGETAALREQNG